jgi:hypothetical protein
MEAVAGAWPPWAADLPGFAPGEPSGRSANHLGFRPCRSRHGPPGRPGAVPRGRIPSDLTPTEDGRRRGLLGEVERPGGRELAQAVLQVDQRADRGRSFRGRHEHIGCPASSPRLDQPAMTRALGRRRPVLRPRGRQALEERPARRQELVTLRVLVEHIRVRRHPNPGFPARKAELGGARIWWGQLGPRRQDVRDVQDGVEVEQGREPGSGKSAKSRGSFATSSRGQARDNGRYVVL